MIDLYKFINSKFLRIVDVDNQVFEGKFGGIDDVEEQSEDYGFIEDSICIIVDEQPIDIPRSEIAFIEEI